MEVFEASYDSDLKAAKKMGYLEGSVEGVYLSILLDGGADVSLIDYDFFQSLSAGTVMEEAEIYVTGASNAPLTVKGRANVTVRFDENIEFEQTVIVVENFKKKFLLGKDFLFRRGATPKRVLLFRSQALMNIMKHLCFKTHIQ